MAMLTTTSCAVSTSFYQVYKTQPDKNMAVGENSIKYENDDCTVLYDLWEDGGDMGFWIYNKTDKTMYLQMKECFFVQNGRANDFYQNRAFSSTSNVISSHSSSFGTAYSNVNAYSYGNSVSAYSSGNVFSGTSRTVAQSGSSVTYYEKDIIAIPAKTRKYIDGFKIENSTYRDCDLLRFPTTKEIKTLKFDETNTPLKFGNIIAYTIDESKELKKFENNFYVTEITNYSRNDISETYHKEYCGESFPGNIGRKFKFTECDMFYIEYQKSTNSYNEYKH